MNALKTLAYSITVLSIIPAGLIAYSSQRHAAKPGYQIHSYAAKAQATEWVLAQIKPVADGPATNATAGARTETTTQCPDSLDSLGNQFNLSGLQGGRSLAQWIDAANAQLLTQAPAAVGLQPKARIEGNFLLRQPYAVDKNAVLLGVTNKLHRASDVCVVLKGWFVIKPGSPSPFAALIWRENLRGEQQQELLKSGLYVATKSKTQRGNPWAALNGCTFLSATNGLAYFDEAQQRNQQLRSQLCAGELGQVNHGAVALPAQQQPAGWTQLGVNLRVASTADAPKPMPIIGQSNQVKVLHREVDQNSHVISSINPVAQEASDTVAQCLASTGVVQAKACAALKIQPEGSASFYEKTFARMLGIVVLDIPSGRIEAISGAHTPCYAQQHDGPGRDKDCPDLPAQPRMNGAALDNHALYADAMPGSLVKPIAALAMMQDDAYRRRLMGKESAAFQNELALSASKLFHDRLFCSDKGYDNCDRPSYLPQAALKLGWNINCLNNQRAGGAASSVNAPATVNAINTADCARISAATGRDLPSQKVMDAGTSSNPSVSQNVRPHLVVVAGQMGIEQKRDANGLLLGYVPRPSGFAPEWAQDCHDQGWNKCRGGNDSAIDMLSEAWGQGDARATPLAVASMFAHLGAAANGATRVAMPHLLQGFIKSSRFDYQSPSRELDIDAGQAQLIVGGLQGSHAVVGGTAKAACAKAMGETACKKIDWIAGKTGTPAFTHDILTISKRRALCDLVQTDITAWRASAADAAARMPTSLAADWARCVATPYKWYAALVKSPGSEDWDKVVVVLAERNWTLATGMVDAPGDRGVNVAASAGFEVIKRLYGNGSGRNP